MSSDNFDGYLRLPPWNRRLAVKRGRIAAKSHSRLFFGVSRSDLSVLHDITKPEFHSKPTSFVCMFCLAISGLKGIPFFMLL